MPRLQLSLHIVLSLLPAFSLAQGQEEIAKSRGSEPQVKLVEAADWKPAADQTIVITHGMGGLCEKDRFDSLARAIAQRNPEANVLLVDWSQASNARCWGLPSPWKVAIRIDAVAETAVALLLERKITAVRLTLIGESFGNCVNFQIAKSLGEVKHLLAFNPASAAGGYTPPDFRSCAGVSWSFHTYSPYDTAAELAHHELFLETPAQSNFAAQHTFGITWLTSRIEAGDQSWLSHLRSLPQRKQGAYCGKATLDGVVIDAAIERRPGDSVPATAPAAPEAAETIESPSVQLVHRQ